jgi:hypothetical protein
LWWRSLRHLLCPSSQLHQAQKFVLRPQPLPKTPSSYFAGRNILILLRIRATTRCFQKKSFWNNFSFLFLSDITRKIFIYLKNYEKLLIWEAPSLGPIPGLLCSGSKKTNDTICSHVVFFKKPKFEDHMLKNGKFDSKDKSVQFFF